MTRIIDRKHVQQDAEQKPAPKSTPNTGARFAKTKMLITPLPNATSSPLEKIAKPLDV